MDLQEQEKIDSIIANYWVKHTDESYFGETYWLTNPIINGRYQLKSWRPQSRASPASPEIKTYTAVMESTDSATALITLAMIMFIIIP